MLSERLRVELAIAATDVGDDDERPDRALIVASRLRRQRRRRQALLVSAAAACAAVIPFVVVGQHAPPPAMAAAVTCLPDRTLLSTHRVVSLRDGAQITIVNRTSESVVVQLGSETAVIAPGSAEGQYPLVAGRHEVRCETPGRDSAPAQLAVLAAHRA